MPATYEPIATTTLGSAQSSVTFSSISGNYTDLVLIVNASGNTGNFYIRYNSDSSSVYSRTGLYGDGSSVGTDRYTNSSGILVGNGIFDTLITNIIQIQNYSNTTTFKTCVYRTNKPNQFFGAGVGLWRSTSAITSVTALLADYGGNAFNSGSTFTLYGIKAA